MARMRSPLAQLCDDPYMAGEVERLRESSMPELLDEYERVFGKAPRVKHRAYLWKRIAQKIQENRYGGLSKVAKKRLEELIAQLGISFEDGSLKTPRAKPKAQELIPGTSIVRDWKGKRLVVTVREKGFEYEGQNFRSLTAVAKAITGSHLNGRAFFNIPAKGKAS